MSASIALTRPLAGALGSPSGIRTGRRERRVMTATPSSWGPSSRLALRSRPAWAALTEHYQKIRDVHLRDLFASDPDRGERLTMEAAGLYLDYSKNRITDETLALLFDLADQSGLAQRTAAMFAGERINTTENRAVLHLALRMPRDATLIVDGVNVVTQ